MRNNNQRGFGAIEAVLIIVVVALVAFIGWRLYAAYSNDQAPAAEQSSTQTSDAASSDVPEVNNSGDLEDAEQYLKGSDVNAKLDTSELEAALQ